MKTHYQLAIAASALVVAAAVAYNYFVLVPKQQAFSNCMRSYNSTWDEFLATNVKTSAADLCEKGYGFDEFVHIGSVAREEVNAQYSNPDAVPQDTRDKQLGLKVREKIGL